LLMHIKIISSQSTKNFWPLSGKIISSLLFFFRFEHFPFWTIFLSFAWLLSAQKLICDGTVKASTAVQQVVSSNIDFSLVSVKLFTDGEDRAHLKDEVQCIKTGLFFYPFTNRGILYSKYPGRVGGPLNQPPFPWV